MKLKGKELRPGMHVIIVKHTKRLPDSGQGIPITVKAIEYPFVVFEVELPSDRPIISLPIADRESSDRPARTRFERVSFSGDVRKCRFRVVDIEYVNAYRATQIGEPDWLNGEAR